ncbi:hypothetical protein [Deinococcus soli (ex Cha et al. 2016)]|uniref:Ribosomal protein S27AE n=1 Tax=Deinococcus soli (ex Cha et al. 2016) TaxID=1309411 RepID=A0AAE3XDL3_9DEIO|nr:hypothetical protein [Deinococcus soli (ex Cha et al. 2016)]MDR6218984.1 ribosomal protein S27AE [Deinococcus soli (ex Cha et al. 2016)]MDR6328781.1 ribosomal protein S27AE [Deinococcus soli (ex Cha et al. 2016)]
MTAPTPVDLLTQAGAALRRRQPAGALLSRAYHQLCAQALADQTKYPDRLSRTLQHLAPSAAASTHLQAAVERAEQRDWGGAARHVACTAAALCPGEEAQATAQRLERPWVYVQGQLLPDAGTFNDEPHYHPDSGRYNRRALNVTCPNCARTFAPHMSRLTTLADAGTSWVGFDHTEPYAQFVTRCGRCAQTFTFRTVMPQ